MASLAKLATIDVRAVSGLSGKRGAVLRGAGIRTVADLLFHLPRRYLDRSLTAPVAQMPIGEELTVIGKVVSVSSRRPRRGLTIVEAKIGDGTGMFRAVWFNQPFRQSQLEPGIEVALSGKAERFRGTIQMTSPDVDVLSGSSETLRTGRLVPIHPAVGEVGPGWIRRAVHNALKRARPIPDPLPKDLIERHGLVGREQAFSNVHFPEETEAVSPARRRLVFDELFRLELALALTKRRHIETSKGISHISTGELADRFISGLPYELTGAQQRALAEISSDLAAGHPMHRLLQGEVGSGKTVVAVAALLQGIEGGYQGAVMAPTEVLATQHFLAITSLLADARLAPALHDEGAEYGMGPLFGESGPGVRVALLTSGQAATNFTSDASRSKLKEWVSDGRVDMVVGTHALIQEGVHFPRLGIAVVDEQHRFGVAQRVMLKDKGGEIEPDLLIMTATPIPRTLSMTLYGDLDITVIDEMPPGRQSVETLSLPRAEESRAWELIRSEVAAGRQGFVVCPLVEDSDKIEATSAVAEYERLSELLSPLRIALLHGQLHPREKATVMAAFRAGETDVLVATTVIEVGIDMPNATVIVVEDADRFGLSQLHQLRGRVGRGPLPSKCVLLADPTTAEGEARIAAMVATNDGFLLAEEDLRLRGQGTVFGTRQSGMADLRLADILRDFEELVAARRDAFALVDADPVLERHPDLREEVKVLLGEEVEWLFVS